MKKLMSFLLVLALGLSILTGCSSNLEKKDDKATTTEVTKKEVTEKKDNKEESKPKSNVTLTLMQNSVGEPQKILEDICKEFTNETGTKVEVSSPGGDYEGIMRTRMAANDLPDLFTTHGWSVARYSEYLIPVNDFEWASKISPLIKPIITDDNGQVFVLPVDVDLSGFIYNETVLKEAGVNVDDILTWNDFELACEKVKAIGKVGLHIGGKSKFPFGRLYNTMAPSFFVTDKDHNYSKDFAEGTFDWDTNWVELNSTILSWNEKGYINVDAITADYQSSVDALASNKAAFGFYGNSTIGDVHNVNPDAVMKLMAIPSKYEADSPVLVGGERTAIGIWKDTKHMAEASELLNFFARPENVSRLASSNLLVAGLQGVESDTGVLADSYEKYSSLPTTPYFDRVQLPGGMWPDLIASGSMLMSGMETALEDATDHVKQSYKDKMSK